jgi:hypothetical protein
MLAGRFTRGVCRLGLVRRQLDTRARPDRRARVPRFGVAVAGLGYPVPVVRVPPFVLVPPLVLVTVAVPTVTGEPAMLLLVRVSITHTIHGHARYR